MRPIQTVCLLAAMVLPAVSCHRAANRGVRQGTSGTGFSETSTTCRQDEISLPPGTEARKDWIVVNAVAKRLWIDGEMVGYLDKGRIPLRTSRANGPNCPSPVTKEAIDAALKKALAHRNPSKWKMKLNVSYSVRGDLVRLLMARAGRMGVASMVVHRFMEHP